MATKQVLELLQEFQTINMIAAIPDYQLPQCVDARRLSSFERWILGIGQEAVTVSYDDGDPHLIPRA